MGRKLFTVVNDLCDKYEEKFGEKVATASVVNVLIAEALIRRGLIPKDYIRQKYGCDNPIDFGFTPNARKEKPQHVLVQEQKTLAEKDKVFKMVLEQWQIHPALEWRHKWVKQAEKWKDQLPHAKALWDLANKEAI
jgi:hypothetical protein